MEIAEEQDRSSQCEQVTVTPRHRALLASLPTLSAFPLDSWTSTNRQQNTTQARGGVHEPDEPCYCTSHGEGALLAEGIPREAALAVPREAALAH